MARGFRTRQQKGFAFCSQRLMSARAAWGRRVRHQRHDMLVRVPRSEADRSGSRGAGDSAGGEATVLRGARPARERGRF